MKLAAHAEPQAVTARAALAASIDTAHPPVSFLAATATALEFEARKLVHDPSELITRAIQPALWLLLFGETFNRLRSIPTGHLRYIDYVSAGVLAQSVLFVAIFYGMQVTRERDAGVIVKFLVSPASRVALVLGKSLSAGIRGAVQAVIVYILAALLHVLLRLELLPILGVLAIVILGAALFSTFSLIIACIVKTQQRVMGIGQIMTMPLFFASNAIYPISLMPPWLQIVSRGNPLTYEVDGLRSLMIQNVPSLYSIPADLLVLLGVTTVLIWIASYLYPKIII